jgi:PAS domain S-box-containing protein
MPVTAGVWSVLASELEMITGMPRAFLDSLGVGVVLVEPNSGRVLYASNEFCRMTGYSLAAFTEQQIRFSDITHPDDRAHNMCEHERLLNGEIDRYQLEKRYLARHGAIVWVRVTASVVRTADGRARWSTAVVEDITARKMLEQQLAIAEEIGGLATWTWSVRSGSSQTSPRYNALFGLAEEVPQPSIDEFLDRVHPDDRKSVASTIRRALAGGDFTHEYRVVQPSGEIRWMRAMATVVRDADNQVSNLVGATIDITEVKNRQQSELAPKAIRDVVRHIEANWNRPLSIPEIAREHGVSPRSIHKHFAASGITPMNFIKRMRLERARAQLGSPTVKTSVTGVAFACGFTNLGHFARDYRQAFGELPSETLRSSP